MSPIPLSISHLKLLTFNFRPSLHFIPYYPLSPTYFQNFVIPSRGKQKSIFPVEVDPPLISLFIPCWVIFIFFKSQGAQRRYFFSPVEVVLNSCATPKSYKEQLPQEVPPQR